MRSKRLLTLLLVFCMVFSCIAPAAAVKPGVDVYDGTEITEPQTEETEAASEQKLEVIASEDGTTRLPTLRDDTSKVSVESKAPVQSGEDQFTGSAQREETAKTGSSVTEGTEWVATPTEKPEGLELTAELPASVAELREAAEIYSADKVVSAFVVMEEEPLVSLFGDINEVPAADEAAMEQQQAQVIDAIETEVLGGASLQVDRQFTYLANAFSITTEFGNLEAIAQIPGVKSVFLMPVYQPVADDTLVATDRTYEPYTVSSGEMSGVPTVWENLGLTGSGMTVAIIDTGLDLDHPSFAAAPEGASMTAADIEAVLTSLNAYSDMDGNVTAYDLYRSEKVPYAFNYVDMSLTADHSADSMGDHGTHVAGIAAANAVDGSGVVGMAPDAQLVVMKVFGANGGAYTDDIVAALEDAMTLGVDVVNMSLGSSAGFTSSAVEFVDSIYANIAKTNTIVNASAGNDGTSSYGNMWGTDMNTTSNPDNAAVGSPSTYANVNSIASVDNSMVMAPAICVGGVDHMYSEAIGLYVTFNSLAGQDLEYVMVPGLGEAADFEGLDVTGKVAVIARGTINFALKLANAEANGAIGVVITNNAPGSISNFGMSMTDDSGNLMDGVSGNVPCVLVSMECGEAMAALETKTFTVYAEDQSVADAAGGQMSSFSSWGPAPDLGMAPDMAGVGGSVYSCYDGGTYGLMSGTSMSAPQVAGMTALVMEYLKEKVGVTDTETLREMANGLLMSTAVPVVDTESAVEASPRQQGAGLVNAYNAVTAEAYVTVEGTEENKPKAELGSSANGTFSFTFTVHNFSEETKTYVLDASLLTEDVIDYGVEQFMAGYDVALGGSVTFSQDTVTVSANGTASVTVTIALDENGKSFLDTYYPDGGYVEGYVYLTDDAGVDLSIPYLGFYGDWSEPSAFDTAYWYDNSFWGVEPETGLPEGNEYWHVLWTDLGGTSWVLGMNPYYGASLDEDGNIAYDPSNNVISNNGDGVVDNLAEIYMSLMRNTTHLYFSYQVNGEEVYWQDSENAWKTMYLSNYGQVVPYVHSWWYETMYDFADSEGNPLPHGTEMDLVITATLEAEGAYKEQSITIPLTLDWYAPELVEDFTITTTAYDGKLLMNLRVSDDTNPAYAVLLNPTGTSILSDSIDFEKMADGTYAVSLDITDMGSEFLLALGDYGANEAYYTVEVDDDQLPEDGNLPEMDTDALYAYRVYDAAIYDDSLFGWITIDKETAETTQLTNDMYEYYAINAAEYVDGYIFAVDAGGNFVVMEPGLFYRKTICNLGVNVLDMTFNDADDTMYMATKTLNDDGYTYSCTISTLDLTTGDVEPVHYYESQSDMPYAMTATDDGTIYAIKYYDSGLYTVNQETWELEPVLDADNNEMKMVRATGNYATPYYSQSMTYSAADDCIYWAFFTYTSEAELFAIDLRGEVPTYTAVEFPVDAECVGLLTMEEDEYTLPEGTAVEKLVLSAESMILMEGEQAQLTASVLPWNYEPSEEIVWTSNDETIASVADGVVTAVSEGTTTITASCEGVSASCVVNVVKVEGTLYAYNYFNYSGEYETWVSVDLAEMTTETLYPTPVDFMAADYNGHDRNIYGYDLNGQCYRFNPETGECVALGSAVSTVPADMAYDYSSGYMYAITVNEMTGTTLHYVNMNTGALVDVAQIYDYIMTLACDTEGGLYGISSNGVLYYLYLYDMSGDLGGVVEPLAIDDAVEAMEAGSTMGVEMVYIMEGLGYLQYAQSMCFDHNNRVLLWAHAETANLVWIDIYDYKPYALALGDPTNSGMFEFMGLYTIPEEIEDLADVPVANVTAEDMMLMVGGSKLPALSIEPLNATCQDYTMTSSDESVVAVDENGNLVGVAEGTATITVTLVDEVSGKTFTCTFTVTVKESSGYINGFVASDLYSGRSQYWTVFSDQDPTNDIDYPAYCDYFLYAEEYWNGKLYAYGYDPYDWEANFKFMVINEETYEIESMTDMGDAFPFVYDMTFDYTTGTMFAVAGPNDSASDLYIVNLYTGELLPVMQTEPFFTGLTATKDGTLYAISPSEKGDYETYTGNAKLYELDVENGTYEVVFDLGVQCNKLASMAYDYDNGNIYWAPLFQASYWDPMTVNGLYMIDLEAEAAYDLGKIGYAGSQITGMYIIADEYPELPTDVVGVVMTSQQEELGVGGSVELEAYIRPHGMEAKLEWSSSDESVVTVDENGVVTAIGPGKTTVVVTTTDEEGNVYTASCTIIVYSEGDYLLTYNRTDAAFAKVNRDDPTVVTNLTKAEDYAAVRSMAMQGGVIYGYDTENKFFKIEDLTTFERKYLGEADVEVGEAYTNDYSVYGYTETVTPYFEVRDMAWDGAEDRMLAIGTHSAHSLNQYEDGSTQQWNNEMVGGCAIYEVDMTTGALTELYNFGDSYSNIYTLTVDPDGVIYSYSSYDDYVIILDLEKGTYKKTTSLQNQGVYGDSDGNPMAMDYDPMTGNVYMLFTQNGTYYQLVCYTPSNGAMSVVDYVGEVERVYNPDTWSYDTDADLFAGLIVMTSTCMHEDIDTVGAKEPTCEEDGMTGEKYCADCGEKVSENEVAPATGHDTELEDVSEATCEEDGYTGDEVCQNCGEIVVKGEVIPATGHGETELEGASEATCEEDGYTGDEVCSDCGEIVTEGEVIPATGHDTEIVGAKDPTMTEPGYTGDEVCKDCGETVTEGETLPATGGTVVPEFPSTDAGSASDDDLPFVDVDSDDWFYDDVKYIYENGLMNGVDNTHFAPDATLTRGMIVTILHRMEGKPDAASSGTFTDVAASDWYGEAVEWAAENGIVKGYDNGKYGPNDAITREQLAAILFRYASYKGYDVSARADLSRFSDADTVSAYAVEAMQWAVAEGLINGADGKLMPRASATRAQVAAIIRRFLEA